MHSGAHATKPPYLSTSHLFYSLCALPAPSTPSSLAQDPYEYIEAPGDKDTKGYLAVVPPKESQVEISNQTVIEHYATEAAYLDIEQLPTEGIKRYSAYGPFDVFCSFKDAKKIWSATKGSLIIEVGQTKVQCSLFAHKTATQPSLSAAFTREYMDFHTAHIMIFLKSRYDHTYIWPYMVREYFESQHFLVMRADRPSAKIDSVSIGRAGAGSVIHANIRSVDTTKPLHLTPFPPFIVVKGQTEAGEDFTQTLTYQIAPHSKLEGVICLDDKPCHLPFNGNGETCICRLMEQQRTAREEAGGRRAPPAQGLNRGRVLSGLRKDKSKLPCRHFTQGTCHIAKCKFLHTEEMLTEAPVIICRMLQDPHAKRCENKNCPWNHPWDKCTRIEMVELRYKARLPNRPLSRKKLNSSVAQVASYCYFYMLHPRQIWNSTLGYPGEGPDDNPSYKPTTIATFNARGLCKRGRLNALLAETRRLNIHILLIQEHNWKKRHKPFVQQICQRQRFYAGVSYITSNCGGAAVFIDKDAPSVDLAHAQFQPALQGAVAKVTIDLHGTRTPVVSVYAPVHPYLRRTFFERLSSAGCLSPDAIVGGDWNCVPDVSLDVDSHSSYTNAHAPLLDSLLASRGLDDIYRKVNGKERSYTRYSATINSRLDRLYARKYNSHWRWLEVTHSSTAYRTEWASDHLAVIATLETTPSRPPTPGEAKIDPNVYRDPEVRRQVRKLWKSTIDDHHEYDRATAWDMAKQVVATYLLETTAANRRARTKPKAVTAALLKAHTRQSNSNGPSPKAHSIKDKLERQLRSRADPKPKEGWWAYVSSLGEEVSSKQFYRKFKAKFSNSDISSLHITPDWNSPESKSGIVDSAEGVANEMAKYYRWLFRRKPSRNPEPLLQALRKRQISKKSRAALDKPITPSNVTTAIRSLGKGKAPGPDLLASEFYHTFEDLVVNDLIAMLDEAFDRHRLPHTTTQGVIKVLYKKLDPREVRNYRPLTMLNTDYKILTKILAYRVAAVLDEIVSDPQLGFVPGRVITEASHLTKLVQAYLEERDEPGLLVALDWEKAFDSVSWDYLHASVEALGFGPNIRRWYHILYNHDNPQLRTLQVNGIKSDTFELQSSVPQGCPLSPVTFLLISEGLTRLILDDPQYQGIPVRSYELRLSQFADDTLLFLRGYEGLKRAWQLIDMYADATGMRVNIRKTEGIRCGSLKRALPPIRADLHTDVIKWVRRGSWVRLLGIPFWEDYDENLFWEELYLKSKAMLASWRGTYLLTQIGRSMLANTMYLSRFRYWAQCMYLPDHINDAIIEDTQALIWAKDAEFDPDDYGSRARYRRWMKNQAQYGNRVQELGLGVMPWREHIKAIRVRWLFRYLDATRGTYKVLLDQWFARYHEGRGAILTTIDVKDLTKSVTHRVSALPKFWKSALTDLRSLTIDRTYPNQCTSQEEALSMPLWTNPLFEITHRWFVRSWRYELELNTVKDTFKVGLGEEYSDQDIEQYLDGLFEIEEDFVLTADGKRIEVSKLVRQWHQILSNIPTFISKAARGVTSELDRYSDISKKLLTRWAPGWQEGAGIGNRRNIRGRSDPIDAGLPRRGRAGLGIAQPSKNKKPKEKAERFSAAIIDDREVFGTYTEITERFVEHQFTTKGKLVPTSTTHYIHPSEVRSVLRWGGGIVGIADSFFPHPRAWTIAGTNCDLAHLTVRKLTQAFMHGFQPKPSCKLAWEKRLGSDIPWQLVGARYRQRMLTPRDFMTHFKLILHRGLFTRHIRRDNTSSLCRLCGRHTETIQHLVHCTKLEGAWLAIILLLNSASSDPNRRTLPPRCDLTNLEKERLILLGIVPPSLGIPALPQALSDLLHLTWKFVLIEFTLVDLHNKRFGGDRLIGESAARRYISKANTLSERVRQRNVRAEARCQSCDDNCKNENSILYPLATIDNEGNIIWDFAFNTILSIYDLSTQATAS